MSRIAVSPQVLRWARDRAGLEMANLQKKFPKLTEWERGKSRPTLKQLESFAKLSRTPFGFLFLSEPPDIQLPFTDFRVQKDTPFKNISPELMDTIHSMQLRQAWLREERLENGVDPLSFIGAANLSDNPVAIGQEMRRAVGLDGAWAKQVKTWIEAVGKLRDSIESLGIMTVINGVVGNSTRRKLNVEEFRGFALSDPYAPLIFVNGADAKSAQMFTLAHEFAHLWLGKSGEGLSAFKALEPDNRRSKFHAVEQFCDQVAAEFLVPASEIIETWPSVANSDTPFEELARRFKVSPIVIGRRAMDLKLVRRREFFNFYRVYQDREQKRKQSSKGGGNFYKSQNVRLGRLFATHLIRAAKEGRVGFKEAYSLSGLKAGTFEIYANRELGIRLP